ncbi:MAG: hypothetical protein GW911_19495 [Armatimonadetes bacterium]|nr:hypothetical protein [Armatimonadota bacterium]NCP31276.1 hypothetical protein [Armatimonadota bacterium]NCQ26670.1 hypothetical protein [Armatimonadota bacterium]NDK14220.1 hypothetical protein [Armatimonadota bacterium]
MHPSSRHGMLAAGTLLLTSFGALIGSAQQGTDPLMKHLTGRLTTIDKQKPVLIAVTPGGGAGQAKELKIAGGPAMMKDVRVERLDVHALDFVYDAAKLTKESDLAVKSVGKFYMHAEVSAAALTDRVTAGKNTKELSATVSFDDGKAIIRGNFKYSFIRGNFEALLTPSIRKNNQIVFSIDKLKVLSIPAPKLARRKLQEKMTPLDMGDLVGAPRIDDLRIEGDRMKVTGGKPF